MARVTQAMGLLKHSYLLQLGPEDQKYVACTRPYDADEHLILQHLHPERQVSWQGSLRLMRYVEGQHVQTMQEFLDTLPLVINALVRLHATTLKGTPLAAIRTFPDMMKHMAGPQHKGGPVTGWLSRLRTLFRRYSHELTLCHHDLHSDNYLLVKDGDGKKKSEATVIELLDYEFAGLGHYGYELAYLVHFAPIILTYHQIGYTPAERKLFQDAVVTLYARARELPVERVRQRMETFTPFIHLFAELWSQPLMVAGRTELDFKAYHQQAKKALRQCQLWEDSDDSDDPEYEAMLKERADKIRAIQERQRQPKAQKKSEAP